ncbi:hypothetical protein [Tautonia plasticadhaerens]|nr:hypothetical protein [Tautonia plasticadhaerens]
MERPLGQRRGPGFQDSRIAEAVAGPGPVVEGVGILLVLAYSEFIE